jgi:hypothetical protein
MHIYLKIGISSVAKLNEHFSRAEKEGEAGGSPPFKSKKERG